MSSIYSLATRVVAWIGEEENESPLAMKMINKIGESIVVNWPAYTMKPALEGHESSHWAQVRRNLPLDARQISAVSHLLGRSWFGRIWIWQEIHLGPPSSVLLSGRDEILWEVFSNAIFCLSFNFLDRKSVV